MFENHRNEPVRADALQGAKPCKIRDPTFSPRKSIEPPALKRVCSADVEHRRSPSMPHHRSTSDLFCRSERTLNTENSELQWSLPVCDEGHVYTKVGMIFERDSSFPPNVTFAPRTQFKGACFFGEGSTFESRCVFKKSCVFGPRCVFDSNSTFEMPCYFNQSCAFGKECLTAPNSMFRPHCKFVTKDISIIEITPKAEATGFKDDIVRKLERNPKCIICKKRNKSHILQPCGHMVVCKHCSKEKCISGPGLGQCPVCKQRVKKVQKVIIGV